MSEQQGSQVEYASACCPLPLSYRELPTWLAMIIGFSMILVSWSMQEKGASRALWVMWGRSSFLSKAPCMQLVERKVMLSDAQIHAHSYLNNADVDFTTVNPSFCYKRISGAWRSRTPPNNLHNFLEQHLAACPEATEMHQGFLSAELLSLSWWESLWQADMISVIKSSAWSGAVLTHLQIISV